MNWDWTGSTWVCLALAVAATGAVWAWWSRKHRNLSRQLGRSRREGQQFQSVIELFDHPLILTSPDGTLSYCNTAAEGLYEYSAAEVLGRPLKIFLPPERAGELQKFLERIRKGEGAIRTETVLLSKTGRSIEVAITLTPIKDPSGQLSGMCIFTFDISKRKRAEEALAKERFLLETLMETIPDHIYFKDRDSRFIRINKFMVEKFFKLNDASEAIGKTDFDFFGPEHARQAFEDEQQIIRTGQPLVNREEKETWPDGSLTWASTTKVALRDQSGAIIGTFGISRDITDRKWAEEALERRTQELVRSNSELEHFAYAASHDLQEPLRMIASYLQLLVRRCQDVLPPEGKEFIGFAVDGAKRMQSLINDLLLYSRVGRHGKPFVPVDCAEILDQVLANLKVAIEDNHAVVKRGPLPKLLGDPTQLIQLFQNLIGNAIKFRGAEAPVIQVAAEFKKPSGGLAPGPEWVLSVRDNGIGIEPQYFDRIFVIFQRLHTREKYPGTGIGLALCKRIVERHGGRIWVESQPGQGSTFYFTLPQPEAGRG